MKNPLFNNKNNTAYLPNIEMDIAKLRAAISRQDPSFLNSMVTLAKQRGISNQDIEAGIRMLKGL